MLVLRRLRMERRSLPSVRCGINEPNCRPTRQIRTKEGGAKVVQRARQLLASLRWRVAEEARWCNVALSTDQWRPSL